MLGSDGRTGSVDFGGILRPQGPLDPATALQPYSERLGEPRCRAPACAGPASGALPDEVRRYGGDATPRSRPGALPLRAAKPTSSVPPSALWSDATGAAISPRRRRRATRSSAACRCGGSTRCSLAGAAAREDDALLSRPLHHRASKGALRAMTYRQNALFRNYALGNLRELTRAVSKDPAMLDLSRQRRQRHRASQRKLCARTDGALHPRRRATTPKTTSANRRAPGPAGASTGSPRARAFDPALHDDGVKTFLGRTGNFTGDDVVNIIFAQPQCARFFATSLLNCVRLQRSRTANWWKGSRRCLRKHDFELAPVVCGDPAQQRVLFRPGLSRARESAGRVRGRHLQGARACRESTRARCRRCAQMGQVLFFPPNVAGWPGGAELADQRHDDRAAKLLDAACSTRRRLRRRSWLRDVPMHAARRAARLAPTISARRRGAGLARRARGVSRRRRERRRWRRSRPENYDQRVSGAAYLAMAMPAYQLS